MANGDKGLLRKTVTENMYSVGSLICAIYAINAASLDILCQFISCHLLSLTAIPDSTLLSVT